MNYLVHVGILLSACFVYYWFLLRAETHFQLNRWILLACIGASFALPLVTVPADWSLRSHVRTAETADPERPVASEVAMLTSPQTAESQAEASDPKNSILEAASGEAVAENATREEAQSQQGIFQNMDLPKILRWIYLAGVFVFGLHFLLQIGLLLYRMIKRPGYEFDGFRIVELPNQVAPYSFWNRIFLNPSEYDPETFQQIVDHERIHIRQRHSLDILLAELLVVVQWCNPFAWLYRWAMEHNLEFLTDSEMLRQGTDKTGYQMNLVRVSVPNLPQGLTSNYNQNFLKKRIQMMNVKQSTLRSGWKYLALMPLLLFAVLQFNVVAQVPATPQNIDTEQAAQIQTPDDTASPDQAEPLGSRQNAAEISEAPSLQQTQTRPRPNPQPVQVDAFTPNPTPTPVRSISLPDAPADRKTWAATLEGNRIDMHLTVDYQGDHHMNTSLDFLRSDLGELPRNSMGTFSAQRFAGTITFRGVFEGDSGAGLFDFEPSEQLISTLRQNGFSDYNWIELLYFFIGDFEPSFLTMLDREGYEPNKNKLLELMIFGFDESRLRETLTFTEENGFGKPSLEKVIELEIFDVDQEYLRELARAGFPDLELQDAIDGKIHGMSADFIRELARVGFDDLSFREALEMAIHDVNPTYLSDLRTAGYTLNAHQAVEARIHGVSSAYAAELARAGFEDLGLQEVIEARIHGLDAAFVQEMARAGFDGLDFDEIISMSIHGVHSDFVQQFIDAGFEPDANQITSAAIHGVDPESFAEFRAIGFDNLSIDKIIEAKIHGVGPDFAQSFSEFGFRDLSFDDLIAFRIHGVSASFVRRNFEDGDSPEDFINMKIHGRRR
ncbi:MAG: M56 family metallopeptidase [Bacteroidota bacterium]